MCFEKVYNRELVVNHHQLFPKTHTTHDVLEKQMAYSRYDKAEIQHQQSPQK